MDCLRVEWDETSHPILNGLWHAAQGNHDTVSEWLRRWTRNPLGSARKGSNPLAVARLRIHFCRDTCVVGPTAVGAAKRPSQSGSMRCWTCARMQSVPPSAPTKTASVRRKCWRPAPQLPGCSRFAHLAPNVVVARLVVLRFGLRAWVPSFGFQTRPPYDIHATASRDPHMRCCIAHPTTLFSSPVGAIGLTATCLGRLLACAETGGGDERTRACVRAHTYGYRPREKTRRSAR